MAHIAVNAAINSAAVRRPQLVTQAATRFGSQCVVASIDALNKGDFWEVYVNGGRQPTGLDAIDWAKRCAELGAGEILLTSIDRDGGRSGYDIELLSRVSQVVSVPIVASGGAGSAAMSSTHSSAAPTRRFWPEYYDGTTDIRSVKAALQAASIA